jgi:two-component system, response regulator YesN
MNAVVVDDSVIVRERVANLLRELPLIDTVSLAVDGVSGLELIEKEQPELVVLDIHMPSLDGQRVDSGMEMLKAIKSTSNPPAVIMLSNYSEPIYRARCARLGADAFLDKSNEFDKLLNVAGALLARRGST